MASTPHKNTLRHPEDDHPMPARVEGHAVVDPNAPKPADPPVETIADEQRKRSEEMEAAGVAKWVADRDQRAPEDKPKQVASHA